MANAWQKLCSKDFGELSAAITRSVEFSMWKKFVRGGGSDLHVGDEVEKTGKN